MQTPPIPSIIPQDITFGRVFKYAVLPGIVPRLHSLAGVLAKFLFMFTQIFGSVGLIEKNHPCLRPENIGHYRFSDVVGLAYFNMMQDRKNAPKVVMFFAVISTLLIGATTVILFTINFAFAAKKAHAQFFTDSKEPVYAQAAYDWSYDFLSEVFGTVGVGVWGGRGDDDPVVQHPIFHSMISGMLSTYSQALLIIAVFLIVYHIVMMITKSARTGEPFGRNFNSVWAPIRLAIGIGLMVPISHGYNGAQLLCFQVSSWGSALATNIWLAGVNSASTNLVTYYAPPEPYNLC